MIVGVVCRVFNLFAVRFYEQSVKETVGDKVLSRWLSTNCIQVVNRDIPVRISKDRNLPVRHDTQPDRLSVCTSYGR